MVRLFVLQDNRRFFVDVPYDKYAETSADYILDGAEIYHATVLANPSKQRKSRTGARLKQRMY
jgi:hypothetical protein